MMYEYNILSQNDSNDNLFLTILQLFTGMDLGCQLPELMLNI